MEKRNLKTIILTLLVALMGTTAMHAGEADDLLKKTVGKLKGAQSVTANFTMTQNGRSANGTLTVSGNKFVMGTGDMTTWFNGKTQWTMSRQAGECNITEPTPEEVAQVNPIGLLNSYTKYYTAKMLKGSAGYKKVQLTAKSRSNDVSSAVVTISSATFMPAQISVTMRSGGTTTVKITKLTTGKTLPASTFTYPAKSYPKIEVVDLR